MALFESRLRLIENEEAAAALIQTEKLAAVGRLAFSMAHEINNPLAALTNLLYLSRQRAIDPDVKDWLAQADRELRRISIFATQALRFHKQTTKPQIVTCFSLFSATLSAYEGRLTNSRIELEKRKRAAKPVECFEGDIRQVLSNVISNAIDAMPTGGRLIVRSRESRDWKTGRKGVVLTVADTGIGVDHETQRRMFEAFFSTKGIGGSGLGLWICEEIMRRHGGRISIRSRTCATRSGTMVALFLPFGADAEEFSLPACRV